MAKYRTILGTRKDDFIFGFASSDDIISWEGNDVVHGRGGEDYLKDFVQILGSRDSDKYYGDAGNDHFSTTYGHDFLSGGSGKDDFVSRNPDSFRIDGGSGVDEADIWMPGEFDVVKEHYNSQGKLDRLVLHSGDQIIRIENTEHVYVNHGGDYFEF